MLLKAPAKIREDAIRMGVRKAATGCDGCADSYFELARQNGATENAIQDALHRHGGAGLDRYLNRREMLKGLALTVGGTAAVASGLLPLAAAAASNTFGIDTNTTNCCGMPMSFYIGRFGFQLTQTTSGFNVTAAQQATSKFYVYEYWDLGGPNWPGAPSNSYAWGANQADAAATAWSTNPNAPYVWGQTIFADVEANEAWDNPVNQGSNQQVLQGWIDQIKNRGLTPGLYISPGNWNSYFGSGFRTSGAVALWITSCRTCSISCAPANPNCGGTVAQVENMYANPVGNTVLGGSQVAVWQYWVGGCAYGGDWNYSTQTCNQFITPTSSTSTYVCPGCGAGSPCP